MKGGILASRLDLQNAYEDLQFSTAVPKIEKLILYAHWVRQDARLGELLVRRLLRSFNDINPLQLWRANRISAFPQALAVINDFAELQGRAELTPFEYKAFRLWRDIVLAEVGPAAPQMFFLVDGPIRPDKFLLEVELSLQPYLRWGFFSKENLLSNKTMGQLKAPTLLAKAKRLVILRQLLKSKKSISVDDYLRACAGQVHRRTAERDLLHFPKMKRRGFTRNRKYHLEK